MVAHGMKTDYSTYTGFYRNISLSRINIYMFALLTSETTAMFQQPEESTIGDNFVFTPKQAMRKLLLHFLSHFHE